MRRHDHLLLTSFGNGSGVFLIRAQKTLRVYQVSDVPTTGIAMSSGRLAICIRNNDDKATTGVIDTWETGKFLRRIFVRECPDIHDVKIEGGQLIVVSSQGNSVIWIDFLQGDEIARKVFPGPPDSWHLNDVTPADGGVFVSGFGNPAIQNWRDDPRGAGLITPLNGGQPIGNFTNPHSPHFRDGKWYVCNSGTNEVLRCDRNGEVEHRLKLEHFTRGLYLGRQQLVVGQSSHRLHGGETTVTLVNIETFDVVKRASLPAAEIYGIERVPRWATKVVEKMAISPF